MLWNELRTLKEATEISWIVGGDFNAVRNRSERSSCGNVLVGADKFNQFIEDCNFIDLPMIGKKFTWFGPSNKSSRLDRFLVDEFWVLQYKELIQRGLPRSISDHAPVMLISEEIDWGPRPFKFINAWLQKEGCREVIKKIFDCKTLNQSDIAVKLRRLKAALKKWNSESCENFNLKVRELEKKINVLEESKNLLNDVSSKNAEIRVCRLELWETLRLQEELLKQKARMDWMAKGDSNTAFFHRVVKIRAKKKSLSGLMFGVKWCDEPRKLKRLIFEHFRDHFDCNSRSWEAMLNLEFKRLSKEEASRLGEPFTLEEIQEAVWSCDESKAPGPDGFNMKFFKFSWPFVKGELLKLMQSFHKKGVIPSKVNSSFITLIPKKENPIDISEFRPISLIGSVYKIIAKIISRRLRVVLEKLISETQCAFVTGVDSTSCDLAQPCGT
ncbi:hypothetical protein GQ457_01G006150 [Hibiscus cannabinus]